MIRKISHFRVYAALDYTTNQLDSMQWTLRGIFPHNETADLFELSKQPINNDWCEKTEIATTYSTRTKIVNIIKNIGCRNMPFICKSDLNK